MTERQTQEAVGSKFNLGGKRVTRGLMVFLCSICSLENGLSSRFLCEYKRKQQGCQSTWLIVRTIIHVHTLLKI